jgi:hypothetical protein
VLEEEAVHLEVVIAASQVVGLDDPHVAWAHRRRVLGRHHRERQRAEHGRRQRALPDVLLALHEEHHLAVERRRRVPELELDPIGAAHVDRLDRPEVLGQQIIWLPRRPDLP